MILAIDIGNTNIVAALMKDGIVINECRYNTLKTEDCEYHTSYLKKLAGSEKIADIIISSVVPDIDNCIKTVCFNLFGLNPFFVSVDLKTGLYIKYDNPNKLGADLICVAVGATKKYNAPVIVVDIGTATTFSVINENNEYLGGMIAPGPFVSMEALIAKASKLPKAELSPTDNIIGTNTVDCMRIGAFTAHSAMIDGMIDRIKDFIKLTDIQIVSTGGIAETITNMCKHKIIYDKNLLFSGLFEIYKMNCK